MRIADFGSEELEEGQGWSSSFGSMACLELSPTFTETAVVSPEISHGKLNQKLGMRLL